MPLIPLGVGCAGAFAETRRSSGLLLLVNSSADQKPLLYNLVRNWMHGTPCAGRHFFDERHRGVRILESREVPEGFTRNSGCDISRPVVCHGYRWCFLWSNRMHLENEIG